MVASRGLHGVLRPTPAPRGRRLLLFRLVLERPVLASAASAASAVFGFMGSAAAPFGFTACSFAACVGSPGAVMTMRRPRCLVPSWPNSMAMPILRRLEAPRRRRVDNANPLRGQVGAFVACSPAVARRTSGGLLLGRPSAVGLPSGRARRWRRDRRTGPSRSPPRGSDRRRL